MNAIQTFSLRSKSIRAHLPALYYPGHRQLDSLEKFGYLFKSDVPVDMLKADQP